MLTEREVLTRTEAMQLNPVALAFIGDTVYSLYVRERLALSGCGRVSQLQKAAAQIVSAKGQSAFMDKLLPALTEEETDVFRRGKNAKKATKSKSASSLEYSRSTGFEAVIGYLYLLGRTERLQELFALSVTEDFIAEEEVKPFKPVHR
jgi:ribonuclease-3 family protein